MGGKASRERKYQRNKEATTTPVHQPGPSAPHQYQHQNYPMVHQANIYPNEPPPPYSATPHNGSSQYQPQTNYQAVSYPVHQQQLMPMDTTLVIPDAFDPGARFMSPQVNIPPPPPGVAPNAAQLAILRGQKVVLGQKKVSKLTGGHGGGYVFW